MTFGGLMAISDLNFKVRRGMIKAIIGPNGAGKTTLFNVITGSFPPTQGTVTFNGRPIQHLKAHKIAGPGDFTDLPDGGVVRKHDGFGKCHARVLYPDSNLLYSFGVCSAPVQTQRKTDPGNGIEDFEIYRACRQIQRFGGQPAFGRTEITGDRAGTGQ